MTIYLFIGTLHDAIFFFRIRDCHVMLDTRDLMKMCKLLIYKLVGNNFKRYGETAALC